MATVRIWHCWSQSASFSRSTVNVLKQRIGSGSFSGGTATKTWVAPISTPAALGSTIGRLTDLVRFLGIHCPFLPACVGLDRAIESSLPNEIFHDPTDRVSHHCIEHGVQNHTAGRA